MKVTAARESKKANAYFHGHFSIALDAALISCFVKACAEFLPND